MGKEIFMSGNIDIQKISFIAIRLLFFLDIEKVLVANKIPFGKKAISTLLVSCMIIIK